MFGQSLWVANWRKKTGFSMFHHERNTSGIGCNDRQAACHRFENGERGVIEERCIQKDVGAIVPFRHVFVWHRTAQGYSRKSKAANLGVKAPTQRSLSDKAQRCIRVLCLHDGKRVDRHLDSIVWAEIPRTQDTGLQIASSPKSELI